MTYLTAMYRKRRGEQIGTDKSNKKIHTNDRNGVLHFAVIDGAAAWLWDHQACGGDLQWPDPLRLGHNLRNAD